MINPQMEGIKKFFGGAFLIKAYWFVKGKSTGQMVVHIMML